MNKRIIAYSKKTKKPIITKPLANSWVSDEENAIIEWIFNDLNTQEKFTIEISNSSDFPTLNTWSYEELSSRNSYNINENPLIWNTVTKNGIYFFRVKVKGIVREEYSDWSDLSIIQVDSEKPVGVGIDLVYLAGVKDGLSSISYTAESHSNTFVYNFDSETEMGYYIGNNFSNNILHLVNDGSNVKTFFGEIIKDDLSSKLFNEKFKVITEKNSSSYFIRVGNISSNGEKNGIQFAISLNANEKLTIIYDSNEIENIKYNLRIVNSNYLNNFSNIPQDYSSAEHKSFYSANFSDIVSQYTREMMENFIYIGPCKTPVLQFKYNKINYDFNLINNPSLELPIGISFYNEKINTNNTGSDNSVLDVLEASKIQSKISNNNIKKGDYIRFQSSFDSYSPTPYGNYDEDVLSNYFIDPYKLNDDFYYLRNSLYEIQTITNDGDVYEFDFGSNSNFQSIICNKRYSRVGDYINGISAFESILEEIKDSNSTVVKSRYLTDIYCNEDFSQNILKPNTLSPVGNNGLSERWIGIKPVSEEKFIHYPIIFSENNKITIVSKNKIIDDFQSMNWNVNEELDFYISGDSFIPQTKAFVSDVNNLYAYIKFDSEVSPMDQMGYVLKKHLIVKDKDLFDNDFYYVDRTLSDSFFDDFKWVDISTNSYDNFIKLSINLAETSDSMYIYELFADGKNKSGNYVSDSNIKNSLSCTLKPYNFYFGIKDNLNIESDGKITINNEEKHAASKNVVVDLFNLIDNYKIDYFRISEFNPNALINTSSKLANNINFYNYLFNPSFLTMYWKKWTVGANYRCRIEVSDQKPIFIKETGLRYFKVFIKKEIPNNYIERENEIFITDLKDIRFDIIGSFLTLNNSAISYPIIGVESSESQPSSDVSANQFDFISYDKIVLLGEPDNLILDNSEFTINTSHTWPDISFNEDGFFATHKAVDYTNTDTSKIDEYELISVEIDESIDYISPSSILSGTDLSAYSENPTLIRSEWNGWFWTEYDSTYRLFLKSAAGTPVGGVRVLFERDTRIANNTSSSTADQVNKGTYEPWKINNTKINNKKQLPISYRLSSTNSLVESVYVKNFNRGWNKINIMFESKLDSTSLSPVGQIGMYYRSDVNDDIYKNNTDWLLPYIDYNSIEEDNSCELLFGSSVSFDKFKENELVDKKCLIKILDASTGSSLSNMNSSVNSYVEYKNNSSNVSEFTLSSSILNIDSNDVFFVQRNLDYNPFQVYFGDFTPSEVAPYSRIPFIANNDDKNDLNYLNSSSEYGKSYRLGKYSFKVVSNTSNKIFFEPVQTGEITGVSRINSSTISITDIDKNFELNSLVGKPININDITYTILSNNSNSINISYSDSDIDNFVASSYRIGYIKDIFANSAEIIYIYVPIGQHRQLLGNENVVRNAAKVYIDSYDISNKNRVFSKAISLKGLEIGSNNDAYVGSIIELDLASEKILSLFNISGQVYDANETEEVIGVYESNPISSPTGFAYWKTLTWNQYTPENTEVEFYIKTAETEDELKTKEYNIDAYGNFYSAFTTSSFDVPKFGTPTAIDITRFSTDGTKTSTGEIKRLRWFQFKVILKSKKENITPTVGDIKITYTTSEESIIPITNQVLKGKILGGFLSANVEIPEGTNIIWGINTSNETDFNKYQIIPMDEAFEVLEPQNQFRIAAKLISSGSATPKIFSITFLYNTDGENDLLNEKL